MHVALYLREKFDDVLLKKKNLQEYQWPGVGSAQQVTLGDLEPVVMDTAFVDETISHPFVVQPCGCMFLCVNPLKELAVIEGLRLDSGAAVRGCISSAC